MGLLLVYSVGFISFGATLTRLVQSVITYRGGGSKDFFEQRASYVLYSVWNSLEVNTALICANLPAFVPLFRVKSVMSARGASTARGGSSSKPGMSSRPGYPAGLNSFTSRNYHEKSPDSASDDQTERIMLTTKIDVEYEQQQV